MKKFEGETSTIRINEYDVSYYTIAKGHPIIFLHGFGTSSATWKMTYPFLKSGYQYIFLDLLGHGKSTRNYYDIEPLELHSILFKEFIKRLNFNYCTLVGHSFGEIVILQSLILLQMVNKIEIASLILVDPPAYPMPKKEFPKVIKFFLLPSFFCFIIFKIFPWAFLIYISEALVFYNVRHIPLPIVCEYASDFKIEGTYQGLRKLAKNLHEKSGGGDIPSYENISIPTFIISGDHDNLLPVYMNKKLADDILNSKLIFMKNAGHAPQEEYPIDFANIINKFLEEIYY